MQGGAAGWLNVTQGGSAKQDRACLELTAHLKQLLTRPFLFIIVDDVEGILWSYDETLNRPRNPQNSRCSQAEPHVMPERRPSCVSPPMAVRSKISATIRCRDGAADVEMPWHEKVMLGYIAIYVEHPLFTSHCAEAWRMPLRFLQDC
jgi:hypothetical protein